MTELWLSLMLFAIRVAVMALFFPRHFYRRTWLGRRVYRGEMYLRHQKWNRRVFRLRGARP